MNTESTQALKKRHAGRNVQRVRTYFGVKQEALAAGLGISQQEACRIEQQEEIEEDNVVSGDIVAFITFCRLLRDKQEIVFLSPLGNNKLITNQV